MYLKPLAAAIALALASTATAESRDWKGEGELGMLITSGNSESTSINSRLGLMHEVERWRNTGEFRSAFAEAGDRTSAEKYRLALESDYKFTERQYWFVRGVYDDDRFSGYAYQSNLTTGYGNRVWEQGERSFLDLSIGGGYRHDRLEVANADGERTEEEAIGRLAGQFDYGLSANALFRQKLSTEVGFEDNDTISLSETSVQATVVGNLSMKVAYLVEHVSDAPAGTEKTDTETSLTLLYGF